MENREWTLLLTFLSNISTKYIHESDVKFVVLFSSLNIFTSVPHFPFSFTIKDVVFHAPNRAHFCYLSQDLLCHTTNINNKKLFSCWSLTSLLALNMLAHFICHWTIKNTASSNAALALFEVIYAIRHCMSFRINQIWIF